MRYVTDRISIGFEHEDLAVSVTDDYDRYVGHRIRFISRRKEHSCPASSALEVAVAEEHGLELNLEIPD